MDELKNFIDNNREAFDDGLLPEGHFERFEQKLPTYRRSSARLYVLAAFTVAASIALLLLIRLPGIGAQILVPQIASQQKCETQEEIEELQIYYNMQMNEVIAQMDSLYKHEKIPGSIELLKETRHVLSDNYVFEKTVLPTLPCSNDGLYAMNQHYSSSLEGLTIMRKQMEKMRDKNQ